MAKRSEMISVLDSALSEHTSVDSSCCNLGINAGALSKVLQALEDAGMLPPEVWKPMRDLDHHRGPFGLLLPDHDFYKRGGVGGYDVREWEDEDGPQK